MNPDGIREMSDRDTLEMKRDAFREMLLSGSHHINQKDLFHN